MNIFNKNVKISATVIILIALVILLIGCGIWYYFIQDNKVLAIIGSLVAGLFVAIIQFIIAWQDYNQTEKLKELKLLKILYDRDDRIFYEEYIGKAKRKLYMMGVTGSRFFKDFADTSSNATTNAKVLLNALSNGVDIKILLPKANHLDKEKKKDVDKVKKAVAEIKEKYPNTKLEVKYFDHIPAHSIFRVDDECIVGPVFPDLESKYTPALYLRTSSPMAHKYLAYFENEWKKSNND